VVLHRNVHIAMRGGVSLEGDLHVPPAASGLLVIVHGGGWLDCMNRRDSMSPYGELIARTLGIATLNVEYRLAQEGGGYPENVMDVICAVQWAHQHVADYGLDDRVGMVGTSAGAHLALMAGLVGERDDLDPGCGTNAALDVVLAYAAPTDLPMFVDGPSEARQAPPLYTGEDCDVPVAGCLGDRRGCTRCVDASPLAHACTATAPIVLLQAPDPYDRLVPEYQARVMAAGLEANGADVTLVIPTDAEMRASGCTPEGGSHALDGCMLMAGGPVVNPLLSARLGPR
jgi:acetyl esterase/lipase